MGIRNGFKDHPESELLPMAGGTPTSTPFRGGIKHGSAEVHSGSFSEARSAFSPYRTGGIARGSFSPYLQGRPKAPPPPQIRDIYRRHNPITPKAEASAVKHLDVVRLWLLRIGKLNLSAWSGGFMQLTNLIWALDGFLLCICRKALTARLSRGREGVWSKYCTPTGAIASLLTFQKQT